MTQSAVASALLSHHGLSHGPGRCAARHRRQQVSKYVSTNTHPAVDGGSTRAVHAEAGREAESAVPYSSGRCDFHATHVTHRLAGVTDSQYAADAVVAAERLSALARTNEAIERDADVPLNSKSTLVSVPAPAAAAATADEPFTKADLPNLQICTRRNGMFWPAERSDVHP